MNHFGFEIAARDKATAGRAGVLKTFHGAVETPAFMPVGTQATVKGLHPEQLGQSGARMLLANTYHLALRPGADVIADVGGLHRFMNWSKSILTDSGGFQVFSLANLTEISDDGVVFRSHIDGSPFELTPEKAIRIQEQIGADCIMCLDVCPPADVDAVGMLQAVERTTLWAKRCRDSHSREDQALFGILQGGTSREHRELSANGLLPLDFSGYAVGGLSVGEEPHQMYDTLEFTVPMLPEEKPRYLMGVGRPQDIVAAVKLGIDIFDCVMPTRNGRNATAFTSQGVVRLRNQQYQRDGGPLDQECGCLTCREFSRAYLRHLFIAKEMLGPILVSLHNISVYQQLMRDLRQSILQGNLSQFQPPPLARADASS